MFLHGVIVFLKNIVEKYNERYAIPYIDLADSGESNRLNLAILGPFLFLFGILDLLVIFLFHLHNLRAHLVSIIYFTIFTVFGALVCIFSYSKKPIPREKAYVKKTLPFYMVIIMSFGAAIYNFYILKQPFNGVLAFCITGFLSICLFTFSPICFLLIMTPVMGVMVPGIYTNFGVTGLMDSILCLILIFCVALYKRRELKKHIMFLKKQKKSLEAKTFGNFTLMYENQVVKFSRSKSIEFMGYLIYKKGSSVNTKELISALYGDHADSARYGSNLRNLIVDIKHTLSQLEIQNFFIAEYNNFRINPEVIKCDYDEFLDGKPQAVKSFAGEFMSQFSWAEEVAGFLEQKALAN